MSAHNGSSAGMGYHALNIISEAARARRLGVAPNPMLAAVVACSRHFRSPRPVPGSGVSRGWRRGESMEHDEMEMDNKPGLSSHAVGYIYCGHMNIKVDISGRILHTLVGTRQLVIEVSSEFTFDASRVRSHGTI